MVLVMVVWVCSKPSQPKGIGDTASRVNVCSFVVCSKPSQPKGIGDLGINCPTDAATISVFEALSAERHW